MSEGNQASSGGIGVTGLLGVAFVVLKLCKVIDWSWWWVTCPFWGPVVLLLGLALLFVTGWALFAAVVWVFEWFTDRPVRRANKASRAMRDYADLLRRRK